MSLHDEYARLTPFELAFPDRTVLATLSERVARETRERGLDDTTLEAFVTTESAGQLVRQIQGPDPRPEAGYPLAALVYQCTHLERAGAPLYLLDTDVVRRLARRPAPEAGAYGGSPPGVEPPAPAGYLQLPQHLLWTETGSSTGSSGGGKPESLDGIFWTVSGAGVLNALPITGLLPDRPGFGALPLPAAPIADAPAWLDAQVRATGDDFASRLPGAERDQLYAVESAGEVLKLLARFFSVVAAAVTGVGDGVGLEARRPAAEAEDAPAGGPRPSALPYTRVSLEG